MIDELREIYSQYERDCHIKEIRKMDLLLEKQYNLDKQNADYALNYAMFCITTDEVPLDYFIKSSNILKAFMFDPRCAIIRCNGDSFFFNNDNVIENYNFDLLIQNATLRQEKSIICQLKAESSNCEELKIYYLKKALEYYDKNFKALQNLRTIELNNKIDSFYLRDLFKENEIFIRKISSCRHAFHILYYKIYIYHIMNIIHCPEYIDRDFSKYKEIYKF